MDRTTMKIPFSFSRRLKTLSKKNKKGKKKKIRAENTRKTTSAMATTTTTTSTTTTTRLAQGSPGIKRELERIRSILASTTLRSMVSQLDRARQGSTKTFIVSLLPSDTSETALETLKRYNVLSAPVTIQNLEGLNREDERATCVGFFSVSDVIDPLVEAFEDEKKLERMQDPINMLQAMTLLGKVASKVFSKKIFQIEKDDVDLVFEPYAKELSILKAMEMFLASRYHLVHRLGIFDPHGEIQKIVSQSDIIRFLQMKNEQGVFKELSSLSLEDCSFCSSERALGLCIVEPHELTINVLKKMRDREISCVGVVYEDVLIANFSASDLRRVTKDHISILGLPIAEFLALSHRTSYGGYSHIESQHVSHAFFQKMNEDSPTAVDRRNKAIEKDEIFLQTVGVSATISDVLNALTYVHRVWVVVEKPKLNAGKPLDVITLTDVLRLFVSEENDAFGEEKQSGQSD